MKPLRFWLILLLVALLPMRGGLAAAMLCGQPASHSTPAAVEASHHAGAHDHAAHAHGAHHPEQHHASAVHQHAVAGEAAVHTPGAWTHHPGESAATHDQCTLCSAFCSAATMLMQVPAVVPPVAFATVAYGASGAPAPLFISDGPERPPRSI